VAFHLCPCFVTVVSTFRVPCNGRGCHRPGSVVLEVLQACGHHKTSTPEHRHIYQDTKHTITNWVSHGQRPPLLRSSNPPFSLSPQPVLSPLTPCLRTYTNRQTQTHPPLLPTFATTFTHTRTPVHTQAAFKHLQSQQKRP
jgi:hypothetical protein